VSREAFLAHLAGGLTTVCRCWRVTRTDGVVFGFTDHDAPVAFDGVTHRSDTGLSASAVVQGTGLSVDNTEALGVLSDQAFTETDIAAGRFDAADVRSWLVNWRDPAARMERFRGTIGEIRRGAGAFQAELRGLTEALNQPHGRVYQPVCGAILGDAACGFDLDGEGYSVERTAEVVERGQVFRFAEFAEAEVRWFERGRLRVLSGAAAGLSGVVKHDQFRKDGARVIELWAPVGAPVAPGDLVRIEAGCDKRAETCRLKFVNFANFRGFPHIPGEDWLVSVPRGSGVDDGGSLNG